MHSGGETVDSALRSSRYWAEAVKVPAKIQSASHRMVSASQTECYPNHWEVRRNFPSYRSGKVQEFIKKLKKGMEKVKIPLIMPVNKLRALNKFYFQNYFFIYLAIEVIQVTMYQCWNIFKVRKKNKSRMLLFGD